MWTVPAVSAWWLTNEVSNLITYVNGPGACASPYGCYNSVARAKYEGITLSGAYRLVGVNCMPRWTCKTPKTSIPAKSWRVAPVVT